MCTAVHALTSNVVNNTVLLCSKPCRSNGVRQSGRLTPKKHQRYPVDLDMVSSPGIEIRTSDSQLVTLLTDYIALCSVSG
jgi:hypothetical protein